MDDMSKSHIGKRAFQPQALKKEPIVEDDENDDFVEEEGGGEVDDDSSKKKRGGGVGGCGRRGGAGAGASAVAVVMPCCQAEKCGVDLTDAKRYHRRHKVCEVHAKAPVVVVAGLQQRFCQQCSRFHELSKFDEAKRSCRMRLAGHNERRRKSSSEFNGGEGSSRRGVASPQQLKESQCRQADDPGNSTYKHFQIK